MTSDHVSHSPPHVSETYMYLAEAISLCSTRLALPSGFDTDTDPSPTASMSGIPDLAASTDLSPHIADHNEYLTVQSAIQSFEDRFEEYMRKQSRLLEGFHITIQTHEKHLRRQQKRIGQLEDLEHLTKNRLDLLLSRVRKAGENNAAAVAEKAHSNKQRQVGRFSIFETLAKDVVDQELERAVLAESASGDKLQGAASGQYLDLPAYKSDEEAWEEYLGFGSRGNEVRPQHGYQEPQHTVGSKAKRDGANNDERSFPEERNGDFDRMQSKSEHDTASRNVRPGTQSDSRLSVVELLDQLGEELLGFEKKAKSTGGA